MGLERCNSVEKHTEDWDPKAFIHVRKTFTKAPVPGGGSLNKIRGYLRLQWQPLRTSQSRATKRNG